MARAKRRVALGDVIAERKFDWRTARSQRGVTVRIGRPVPDPEPGGDWLCPVEFVGFRRAKLRGVQAVHGIDSMQALILALGYVQRALDEVQTDLARRGRSRLSFLRTHDLWLPDILSLVRPAGGFYKPRYRADPPRSRPAAV